MVIYNPAKALVILVLKMLYFIKEAELLEPLMPAIRLCLEHRIAYVRRNAVFAIYTIYRYGRKYSMSTSMLLLGICQEFSV